MPNKPFKIYIGGGYSVQPPHKTKILPRDYLLAFCNVKASSQNEVVDFCNGYMVNPIWVINNQKSITAGFKEIQDTYAPIIKKVLGGEPLTYPDLLIINKGLKNTTFCLSPRKSTEEMIMYKRKFDLIVPIDCKTDVNFYGAPDTDENEAYVKITIKNQAPEKRIQFKTIKNGIFEIADYYPDERWHHYLKYKERMVIEQKIIGTSCLDIQQIEQKIYLQENSFSVDDLSATYSCLTFESMICHLIWQNLNNKRDDETVRNCAVCGDLYSKGKDSKSAYFCSKPECKDEWNKKHEKERYKNDSEFRDKKKEQAKLNKHKPAK